MLLKDKIIEAGRSVVNAREADSIEVLINRERVSSIRFAGSVFHQGGTESDCSVYIRAIKGRKVGIASTNGVDGAMLRDCLKRALDIAGHTSEEPFEIRLPGPSDYPEVKSYYGTTAGLSDGEKVALLARGFDASARAGAENSGILSTKEGEVAVLNSNGVEAYHPYTTAYLSVVSTSGGASGYGSAYSKDISKIDFEGVFSRSLKNCIEAKGPREIKPGRYRVLFEPHAVSELLEWLSYTSFGAKSFHEGTGFLSGRLGEAVTGEGITIYDDGLSPLAVGRPFDLEGAAKKRLPIIEKGVAKAVAYDSFTAALEGAATTGHAQYPGEVEGPGPDHIIMEGGATPAAKMLEALGGGLVVRSFHYVNGLLDPRESLMTGMTRHGTFWAEGGKIKYPVKALRFTEKIMEAFKRTVALSRELETFPYNSFPLCSITAPYVIVDGFNFTS